MALLLSYCGLDSVRFYSSSKFVCSS